MVIKANLRNKAHRRALLDLIDEYRTDPMGGRLKPFTKAERRRCAAALARHPTLHCFLSIENNKVVAAAICFRGYSTFAARPLLNIHDLFVTRSARNKGHARALLSAIRSYGRHLGCCRITLEVRTDNRPARTLYRSIGFKPCTPPMSFWQWPYPSSHPRSGSTGQGRPALEHYKQLRHGRSC